MNADEAVRALRNCKAYKTKSDLQTTMLMAADCIETLQAQLAEMRKDCDITDAANAALHGALEEAKRKTDMAVADIKCADRCDVCLHKDSGRMNWIKTTDSLPDSGERVLVYWLELGDLHQSHVCEYFRKGDIVSDEVVPVGDSPMARLLDAMFGKRGERTIEQDGFYIYDSVDDSGLCRWRRHSDVITHWARIVPPEERGEK